MEDYIKKALSDLNIVNEEFEANLIRISQTDYADSIKLILRFCKEMMKRRATLLLCKKHRKNQIYYKEGKF